MTTTLIAALDVDSIEKAFAIVEKLGPTVTWYKVGKQLFTRFGPEIVKGLKARGKKVFLDMKFHDIPNTVGQAVRSAAVIGADAKETGIIVTAVTVLTSLDETELNAVGINATPAEQVVRLAKLTNECGLNGVVCSALEIPLVKKACGDDFILVVPGIRPAGAAKGDQKRVMTPGEAAKAGAQFIVVGRPILAADDPAAAAAAVNKELADNA